MFNRKKNASEAPEVDEPLTDEAGGVDDRMTVEEAESKSSPISALRKLTRASHGEKKETKGGALSPSKGRNKVEKWRLRTVINHVTFIGDGGTTGEDRLIAWYLLDAQQWSFRSLAEGNALISSMTTTLAELSGTTVHLRCTTQPYPVSAWARSAWANAPEPQEGWAALMERDQRHMAGSAQVDKMVYLGVDLGKRGLAISLLGKVHAGVIDREMQALQDRLDYIDRIVAGEGVEARPVTAHEMEWLLAKSFALGCPVPVPMPDEPTQARLDTADLGKFVSTTEWTAEPLGATKVVATLNGREVERHVVVLTLDRAADVRIPEEQPPWMSKGDQLPFPIEWYARIDIRTAEEVSKDMTKQTGRIDAQHSHWVNDHNKRPPKQLGRQAARASDVEDEMRSGFTGMHTRTKSWFRIAVSGRTDEEASERAAAVIEHFKPQFQFVREIGQYHLAREFVPGEPLSTSAHARHWPLVKVCAGLPQITAEVGDKRGPHIGETSGLVERAVCHDPWYLTEVLNSSGLIPLVGTLGAGKSMLLGLLFYKHTQAGAFGVSLDPAGRLQRLLQLPEMRNIGHSVDLLGGLPGSLSPYAVVPEPNIELIRLDADDPSDEDEMRERMRRAETAARQTRRDLAYQTLRWCLPHYVAQDDSAKKIIDHAVRTANEGLVTDSATDVIEMLSQGNESQREIASHLKTAADRELGRLFFHEAGQERDQQIVSDARATFFNLKGLMQPDANTPVEEWSPEELLARPIMTLASWASVNLIYRRSPNERKMFALDEAHEITGQGGAGRTLVTKIATDSRKNNTAAYLSTQNASAILNQDINNFTGAAFIGRTGDEQAQKAALRLIGKPEGVGYEAMLGNLSRQRRDGEQLSYREFIYRDGIGGEGGRGGIEKIRVSLQHHPDLFRALNTTPGKNKDKPNVSRDDVAAGTEVAYEEGAA